MADETATAVDTLAASLDTNVPHLDYLRQRAWGLDGETVTGHDLAVWAIAALNAAGFMIVPDAAPGVGRMEFGDGRVRRMVPRDDVFVHRGPDRTIDGIPFDVTYHDGDVYVMRGGPAQPGDEPLWMVVSDG